MGHFLKRVIKKPSNKPILFGLLIFAMVFVSGFGIMRIMYNYWLHTDALVYPGLKGLFDYKASLWGDALCLPLIIGAGTTYILQFRKEVKYKNKSLLPLIIGSIGGLLGAIMQAQWIISDTTIPNWSIPTQHHFNYAGWYHAAFFVGVCFAISYIVTYTVLIDVSLKPSRNQNIIKEAPNSYFYSVCQFIIWFCGLLFLHFHYLDDYSNKFSEWQIIGFISLIGTVILFGAKIVINRTWRFKYYSPVLFAVTINTLLSLISIQNPPQCDRVILVAGIFCTSLYIYNSENKAEMAGLFISYALFEYLCQIKISESLALGEDLRAWCLLILCLLLPFCVSALIYFTHEKNNPSDNKEHIQKLVDALVLNMALLILSNPDILKDWGRKLQIILPINSSPAGIGSTLIFLFISSYVRGTFDRIKIMEYGHEYSAKSVYVDKTSQYLVYSLIYFAGVICLWDCNVANTRHTVVPLNWISIVLVVMLFVCLFGVRLSKGSDVGLFFMIVSYVSILSHLFLTSTSLSGELLGGLHWIKIPLIIYPSCGMSVFLCLSMLYNIDLLGQHTIKYEVGKSSIIVSIFGGVCYGLATYQLLIFQTIFHVVQLYLVVLTVFCLLPYLRTSKLSLEGNIGIIKNYARSAVAQDGFLFGIIVSSNTIITISFLEFISNITTINNIPYGIVAFVYFILVFMCGYGTGIFTLWNYCMKNNIEYCKKMREKLELEIELINKLGGNQEVLINQYSNLETWISIQNLLAILLSLPYSIGFLIVKKYKKEQMVP